jgi:glycosyltransferase involved in cell wall biosynthesis
VKILHIIYTHGISGAEKYLDYLLPGLKNYGIDCHLLLICPPASVNKLESFAAMLQQKGIVTTVLGAKRTGIFNTVLKVNRYLKEHKISIVHSHLVNTDLIVSLLKQFVDRKVFIISTKHGYDENVLNVYNPSDRSTKHGLYFYITRYTLKMIDRNISISKGMSDLFYNLGISKEHFPVIHHGIDVSHVPAGPATQYRKAPQQLIIAGRMEIMKGHPYLMEAMALLCKQYPQCVLLVLGEGSLKESLQSQCEKLGINGNVQFLGFQPDPYSFIRNSDVIVLPSLFEPFGLVYIEAHALQVPVVAFDTPAANELMQHNETGLLVEKFNSAQLAEKIILLLKDPAERQRIASNAHRQYLEKFTSATMIKNTAEWYKTLNYEL